MLQTGLTLYRKENIAVPAESCLLFVTESKHHQEQVWQIVQELSIELDCTMVSPQDAEQALRGQRYDLVLYHYCFDTVNGTHIDVKYPIAELAWWYETPSRVPLILVSKPLGEQKALATVRSGISDCILDSQLELLPQAIEQALSNSATAPHNLRAEITSLYEQVATLQEQTITLQQENERLQAEGNSSGSSQEYLSHLSHELRSPLANILQFAKILNAQHFGALNGKQAEYIQGVITCSNHLFELINDYLDIAKIDANHEELFLEQIVVEDICNAALVMLQGRAKEKELELVLDLASEVDFCHADQLRLKQILINLLSNAIKFTETGSVTLKIEQQSGWVIFSVIDTGIGINQEDMRKLFQPFQQLNTPMNRKHKGTGLGLALSRKLAQLHGGDITLTSEVGKGSCFTLTLPVRS